MKTKTKQPSRQYLAQLRNKANGMCLYHATKPATHGNYCAECKVYIGARRLMRRFLLHGIPIDAPPQKRGPKPHHHV